MSKKYTTKVRDQAIEAILIEANNKSAYFEHYTEGVALELAHKAFRAIAVTWKSVDEVCLEAAHLLIDGWSPGQKVKKL